MLLSAVAVLMLLTRRSHGSRQGKVSYSMNSLLTQLKLIASPWTLAAHINNYLALKGLTNLCGANTIPRKMTEL